MTIPFIMKQEHIQPVIINAAVITVSTTRNEETDTSGKTIKEILSQAKIPVRHYAVVPDKIEAIRRELYQALLTCNSVIINGGTGLTHDDCTIEAIAPLLEKKIDGFGNFSGSRATKRSAHLPCSPGPLPVPSTAGSSSASPVQPRQ